MHPSTPSDPSDDKFSSHEDHAASPEERRQLLETQGIDFIDALQLQALGERMEQERQRAQGILEEDKYS